MNFLQSEIQFSADAQYKEYLDLFIKEGERFNGTNIWLGNITNMSMVFSHNHEYEDGKFSKVDHCESVAFGNGRVHDDFFK